MTLSRRGFLGGLAASVPVLALRPAAADIIPGSLFLEEQKEEIDLMIESCWEAGMGQQMHFINVYENKFVLSDEPHPGFEPPIGGQESYLHARGRYAVVRSDPPKAWVGREEPS
jgi:hypothetical protein